ncbi:PAS domain-containing protein [Tolypothrix sp. FACHB-123]|uniref:hybrid sensor histidine kinase/response regulator n=1 Tax=Tolypothrix sp. FACHB-123 TaxID=2692868 RepID=UPI001688B887|nr:PAS domain-containing protein [Tolypothrix sp. FACHB-123]MBD2358669.1 PAS domain-containing protein [Tolypothrix sp. FACHB-123]
MKRDRTGKFIHSWGLESKQAVNLSLTKTAWQSLKDEANKRGISRSELVERFARSLATSSEDGNFDGGEPPASVLLPSQSSKINDNQELAAKPETQRQWLEAVLNLLPIPLVFIDPDTACFTFANQAAKDMAGGEIYRDRPAGIYDTDFYCTDATGKAIPPEQLPAMRVARGEKIQGAELNWHTPQGIYPLLVHADTLPAMYDRPATCVMVFQDIRDRKQTELRLQENQRFIQRVADATPGLLYIYDLIEQRNVYVNRQIADILGYTPAQVQDMGNQLSTLLIHPDDLVTLSAHLERFAQAEDGEIIERVYRMRHNNGEWRWLWSRDLIFTRKDNGSPQQIIGIAHDITERQQAEAALRLSQERYRSLAESLPQLVCMSDADGITNYCNQSWIDYTGLTPEIARASGWRTVLHPDDLPLAQNKWTEALETGNSYTIEFRLKRFDGVYRWHLTRIVPIKAENGSILSWLATATDIDNQKRSEQRERFLAQASQTFAAARLNLSTILDTITQLIGELTSDACVLSLLSADQQWLDTVSYYHINPEIKELIGKLLEKPRSARDGITGQVIQTGETVFLPVVSPEQLRHDINPEYLPYLERFGVYSLLIIPLKVQDQIIGALSISRERPGNPYSHDYPRLLKDIADRAAMAIANARLYEQAQQIADRTARLQSVTAALSESLTPNQVAEVIVEQSRSVLHAAAALVAIVCENRSELEIIHAVGFETEIINRWRKIAIATSSPLPDAIRTGKPVWEESNQQRMARYPHLADTYAKYDYAAWISLPLMVEGRAVGGITLGFKEFSALNFDERAFILAICQQAAGAIARAQLYEAEKRARAAAEVANRTKDEFLAVLSHELRTPLNPILGWTKLLRQGNLDGNKKAIALETIERNAHLQVQLIEDLLNISRILQGKLSLNSVPVNLKATITAAIETISLAAEAKGIEILVNFTSNVGHVLGDAARLQQVMWNLLSNAVKFTPSGGQINIKLETTGTAAQIQVTDTGRGINPEFLPYVFDSFRQADSSITRTFGGLGLGLAIVRHIVELHGGTVKAQSPGEGQGATFTVRLPLLLTSTSTTEVEASTTEMGTLQGIQILAVDDEADNLELVTFILEEAGATAIAVSSAKEVLEVLNQKVPDILLADIGMPEMDGYTLLQKIRALPPQQGGQLKAIALTAYAGEINQRQALEAGFQMYLSKPVDPDELLVAIAQVLQSD